MLLYEYSFDKEASKNTLARIPLITSIDTLIIFEILANVKRYMMKGGLKLYQKYAALRDNAGVTDYEVSKRTGVPTSTLTNWKYGRYTPKIDKLKSIADYFGVPIEHFLE